MVDGHSSEGSFSVSCNVVLNQDKKTPLYEIVSSDGDRMKVPFADFENFYERVKHTMPSSFDKPPKKKFYQADSRLHEKRRNWVEELASHLLHHECENPRVQAFFAPLLTSSDKNDNRIDLGPTERRSLKPRDFEIMVTIGKGSFGSVYLVRQISTKKIYAMKVLEKETIRMRKEEKHVMAERNVLKSNINHPFLVSLHFSFQTRDKLYFVVDYINGGEVFTHLQRERNFSENRSRFYAAEVGCALGYLHENNIIYRDLKPENMLIDRYGHIVLADFGLCKENIKLRDTTATFCGTPEYLAPEVIRKIAYDRTVDWWCLGSVLYEMLFGLPPFYSKNQKEMYDRILNQPLHISMMASPATRDLLQTLLHKDHHKRLGARKDFEEIKVHPFFANINWDKLVRREIKPPYIPKIKSETDDSHFAKEFKEIKPNVDALMAGTTYNEPDANFAGFTYNVPSTLEVK